jgi:hypothetical protein
VSAAPGTAATLAALACALQARLDALHQDIDPSWRAPLGLAAKASDAGMALLARRVAANLIEHGGSGGLPLAALNGSAGRLALLGRHEQLARLCTLALLGRPGVLRCCVQRPARAALQHLLGPVFADLRERKGGAAVPADVAAWPPLAWAWVGYRELLGANAWPHPGLSRLVRLSLPAARDGSPPSSRVPRAATPAAQRLAELDELFTRRPPC